MGRSGYSDVVIRAGSWVVWLIVMVIILLLLFVETASISAWGASGLNNTAAHNFVSIVTVAVDDNRTSEDRVLTVKSNGLIPVVIVSITTVAGVDKLVDEISRCVCIAG